MSGGRKNNKWAPPNNRMNAQSYFGPLAATVADFYLTTKVLQRPTAAWNATVMVNISDEAYCCLPSLGLSKWPNEGGKH